jgi:DNA-binding transcriptional ArsR family regulator
MSQAVFHALAEPHRREMLRRIRDGSRSVTEIADHFDISQQAVSQHLHVLLGAGLVDVEQQGRRRLYAVRTDGLESVTEFLREFWPDRLRDLKRAVEASLDE